MAELASSRFHVDFYAVAVYGGHRILIDTGIGYVAEDGDGFRLTEPTLVWYFPDRPGAVPLSFRRRFMNPGIRDLPIDERIQLVEDVWDSIAEDQQKLELTQAQREELDRRLLAYEKDGDAGNWWARLW